MDLDYEARNELGAVIDTIDNLLATASLILPVSPIADVHAEGLRVGLEDIREKLVEICDYDELIGGDDD